MHLRWGIVSSSNISREFANALSHLPQSEHSLVAVASRRLEDALRFGKEFRVPKYYEGYEQLARDPDVDVVYVSAVNSQHLPVSKMMLDFGKHVVCEKPLCVNERETASLVSHARFKNLFLMEGIWSRFFPSYDYIKTRLQNLDLGVIESVDVKLGRLVPTRYANPAMKDVAGGVTLHMGMYGLQFVQWVADLNLHEFQMDVEEAKGVVNEHGIDVETQVKLRIHNGTATIETSSVRELDNTAVIRGRKGSIIVPTFYAPTRIIDIDGRLKEWPLPRTDKKFLFLNSLGFIYQAEGVRQCLMQNLKESERVPHKHSVLLAHIEDLIRLKLGVQYHQDDIGTQES